MAEPIDMILPLLRDLRPEMDRRFEAMDKRFDSVDVRFDRLDKKVDNIKQAMAGESLLARYAVAEVDERFDAIEKRLAALESTR